MPNIKGDDGALKTIFSNSKIIAVVGHSEKSSLASYQVAKFLQAVGYRVYPVNPMVKQIDGQSCYPSLEAIPEPVDIVNVFRHGCLYPDRISASICLKQNPTMGGVSGLI